MARKPITKVRRKSIHWRTFPLECGRTGTLEQTRVCVRKVLETTAPYAGFPGEVITLMVARLEDGALDLGEFDDGHAMEVLRWMCSFVTSAGIYFREGQPVAWGFFLCQTNVHKGPLEGTSLAGLAGAELCCPACWQALGEASFRHHHIPVVEGGPVGWVGGVPFGH